jgi:hypothetical protein
MYIYILVELTALRAMLASIEGIYIPVYTYIYTDYAVAKVFLKVYIYDDDDDVYFDKLQTRGVKNISSTCET